KARQKSGALAPPELPGFDATTPLSDSRLRPPSLRMASRPAPRLRGSPPITRTTLSNVPCSLPRRTERVHVSMPSPFAQAFPGKTAGRRSHLDFRGLLKLHSRYGPLACSAAQGGLCH